MKTFKNLNNWSEEAQEEFAEEFYSRDGAPSDIESPNPWGTPWNWCTEEISRKNSCEETADIDELIDQIYEGYQDEWKRLEKEEE